VLLVNPAKLKSQNHTEKPQNFLIKLDLKKKKQKWSGGGKKTLMRMQKFTTELFLEKKRKEKKIICGNTVAGGDWTGQRGQEKRVGN